MTDIDTADHVRHAPTGETWVVAYVRGDRLCACGWPETIGALSDCKLVKKAIPQQRTELLKSLAKTCEDTRGRYARERLSRMGETAA